MAGNILDGPKSRAIRRSAGSSAWFESHLSVFPAQNLNTGISVFPFRDMACSARDLPANRIRMTIGN
jgi:hypothetical protein